MSLDAPYSHPYCHGRAMAEAHKTETATHHSRQYRCEACGRSEFVTIAKRGGLSQPERPTALHPIGA